ncbi:MAG: response regulator transcription factor [Bacteroidales bacterium]|nr:response regulator transcription factor [Bacteroidales bacterium]
MGQFRTVVVIEQNYLIQAGLEAIISELPGMVFQKACLGTENNLSGLLIKQNPDVIIVNPEALTEPATVFLNTLNRQISPIIIGLTDSKAAEHLKSPFTHLLFFSDNKLEIQKKIRDICEPVSDREDKKQVLSKREVDILKEVALGLTNQEIANKLFLSVHTVMTHRKNINKKLGIKTVSGLTMYALMNQLVSMEEMENKQ